MEIVPHPFLLFTRIYLIAQPFTKYLFRSQPQWDSKSRPHVPPNQPPCLTMLTWTKKSTKISDWLCPLFLRSRVRLFSWTFFMWLYMAFSLFERGNLFVPGLPFFVNQFKIYSFSFLLKMVLYHRNLMVFDLRQFRDRKIPRILS